MRITAICLLLLACGGKSAPEKTAPVSPGTTAAGAVRLFDRTLHARDVNGTRLTYRLLGDSGAIPVVFIHGSLGDVKTWNGQETAFSQRYRVLIYSRRYHPPNPFVDDAQTYSVKLHVEDLAGLLLSLDLGQAHIVGSSYGSYIALELAREHPELVRSLVLSEPPIFPLLESGQQSDALSAAFYARVLDPTRRAFARGDSTAGLRAFVDGTAGETGRFDRLPAPNRTDALQHAFELRREMLANRREYYPDIRCADLARVTTPVLLVKGDRGLPVFAHITDELARCLQSDTTVMIPSAGYLVNSGNPTYYNLVVLRFLASH